MIPMPKCECGSLGGLYWRDDRYWCGDCLWKEIEQYRLQAELDKYPKTADGVPIVPGTDSPIWYYSPHRETVYKIVPRVTYSFIPSGGSQLLKQDVRPESCYSTQAAAEAAKGGE